MFKGTATIHAPASVPTTHAKAKAAVKAASTIEGEGHHPHKICRDQGRRRPFVGNLATQNEAAYRRQHTAAADLVARMRARPDGWAHSSFHNPTNALWVDPCRDIYRCPAVMEKLGKLSDGGKWVCGVDAFLRRPGCVVYSFGSNGDTSFE